MLGKNNALTTKQTLRSGRPPDFTTRIKRIRRGMRDRFCPHCPAGQDGSGVLTIDEFEKMVHREGVRSVFSRFVDDTLASFEF